MIPTELRRIEGAELRSGDPKLEISSVVADSRRARSGSLFVALRGSRVDGHDFVADARSRGALAALVAPGRARRVGGMALLEADDPLAVLGRLGRRVRRSSRARVVGIGGAAGKTSTKDILEALCAPHVSTLASEASYNNELGVPLTLCRIEQETRLAVCELGTGAPGELSALASLAEPDVGVITCLGPEHLESFGTLEGAARAEAELIAALPPRAPVVLPADEPLLERYLRDDLRPVFFGGQAGADVYPLCWRPGDGATEVGLSVHGRTISLRTNLRAPHQALNLCAAVGVYVALGLPPSELQRSAAAVSLSPFRDEERPRAGGGLLINDAYNANPVSMRAALSSLATRRNGGRTVAVLGEMAELGPDSERWHRAVGRRAAETGLDLLVAVGDRARAYLDGATGLPAVWCPDLESAAGALAGLLRPGDVVLLKASRAAGLERLAEAIE